MKQRLIGWSFIALSSLAIADDPPELGEARAASGIPTTARFFGGATTDDGLSYTNRVDPTTPVDIVGIVRVESTHINTVGNIYIVVQLGESYFFRNEEGNFLSWDLKLESLKAAKAEKKLNYDEAVIILDNIALGLGGLAGQTFYVYLAYDSIAALGDLFYSGSPISISVNPDELVDPAENSDSPNLNEHPVSKIIGGDRTLTDSDEREGELVSIRGTASDSDGSISSTKWLVRGSVVATGTSATISLPDGSTVVTFRVTDNQGATAEESIIVTVLAPSTTSNSMDIYTASISKQVVQARCVNCHGAIARLRLIRSSVDDYIDTNYNSMVNYIRRGGSSSIIRKPQGIGHGGGLQLSAGSTELNNLKQFVDAVLSE